MAIDPYNNLMFSIIGPFKINEGLQSRIGIDEDCISNNVSIHYVALA